MKYPSFFTRQPGWSLGAVAASVGLSLGLAIGVFTSQAGNGLPPEWSGIPIHASATDAQDNYAIATGLLDTDIEALFFLDALTGDLKAAVINNRSQKFQAFFQRNIMKDFGDTPVKNPRFLMVTGRASFQRQANRQRFGDSIIYVMELQSGQCVAYAIPAFVNRAGLTNQQFKGELFMIDRVQFRNVKVRGGGAE